MVKPLAQLLLITLLLLGLSACAGPGKGNEITRPMTLAERIGNAYGIHYFPQVEQIQYMFNVKIGDEHVRRFWVWEPKLDRVTYQGMDYQPAVTYYRHDINDSASSTLKKIDAWFINDNYWLFFPFHIVWEAGISLEDIGRQKLPLGEGEARCVTVTFPASGGSSSGDVYQIYLNNDYRLLQWIYRRGGSQEPTRITTWENYRQAGPLVLALNHQAGDDGFRLWFTGVGVKLKGIKNWMFTE